MLVCLEVFSDCLWIYLVEPSSVEVVRKPFWWLRACFMVRQHDKSCRWNIYWTRMQLAYCRTALGCLVPVPCRPSGKYERCSGDLLTVLERSLALHSCWLLHGNLIFLCYFTCAPRSGLQDEQGQLIRLDASEVGRRMKLPAPRCAAAARSAHALHVWHACSGHHGAPCSKPWSVCREYHLLCTLNIRVVFQTADKLCLM